MAISYVSVTEKNLNKGINQLSVEDALPDGFVEDAVNVEISSGGIIEKRKGYVNHLGELPTRAVSLSSVALSNELTISFASTVKPAINKGDYVSLWMRPSSTMPLVPGFAPGVFSALTALVTQQPVGASIVVSLPIYTPGVPIFMPPTLTPIPAFSASNMDCVVYGIGTESSHSAAASLSNRVQHIDSFVSVGTSDILRTIVCAHKETFFVEQPYTTQFKIPHSLVLQDKFINTNSPIVLKPGFVSSASAAYRCKFDGGGEGYASILSITFNAITELFDVLLDTPNVLFTPGSIKPLFGGTTPGAYAGSSDALTIEGAEFVVLNGQHSIHRIAIGSSTSVLSVHIQEARQFESDYDCGATGRAGVFTQELPLSPFGSVAIRLAQCSVGDKLYLPDFPEFNLTIWAGTHNSFPTSKLFLNGVVDEVSLQSPLPLNSLVIPITHVGKCFTQDPQRRINATVANVRGATVNYAGVPYEIKRAGDDLFDSVPMYILNGEAVLSPLVAPAIFLKLQIGDVLSLTGAGEYSREYVIKSVSPTTLILDATGLDDSFGALTASCQNNVTFYETIDTSEYVTTFMPSEGFWRPLTSPSLSLTPTSALTQDYQEQLKAARALSIAQPIVRSISVANTLMLNNGTDEPLAFDGFAIRRAGLFPWKPIQTVQIISGTALVALKKYRYYARLEYVDQSGQLQAGNTSSANDFKVTIPVGGAFASFTLSAPPIFKGVLLEYDRLFISLYRTQADEIPFVLTGEQFHLVERIPVSFNKDATIIYFTDKMPDSILATQPSDNLIERTRGLSGSALQLAADFVGPPRALFNTTLNGRLFLANSREYPTAEITFSGSYDWSTISPGVTLTLIRDNGVTIDPTSFLRFSLQNIVPSSIPLTGYTYNGVTGVLTVLTPFTQQFCWAWDDTSAGKQVAGFLHFKNVAGQPVAIQKGLGTVSFSGTARFLMDADVPVPLFSDALFGVGVDTTASLSTKSSTLYRIATVMSAAQQGINRTFVGWQTWSPIMTVVAGNDLANTESILFSSPYYTNTKPIVQLNGKLSWGGLTTAYCRGQALAADSLSDFRAPLLEQKYISRMHFSFPDFPENFAVGNYVDVNAADGQAITGIIPFFSQGTSVGAGAAGQESSIVVFKTNSIYLVKVSPNGVTATVKLETQGLGCTAPYSIAPTNDGIMFANETGIYRLGQSNRIEPIGRNIERLWKGTYASQTSGGLQNMFGHHFGKERIYRLSLPLIGTEVATDSLSYNHTNEGQGSLGAWSRHTQMPYLQWCNLLSQEYVSSTRARVYRRRDFSSIHDYVDAEAFSIPASVDSRMTDFGDPATRKRVLHLTCTFRTPIERGTAHNLPIVGTTVALAVNQSCSFENAQEYVSQGNALSSGLAEDACVKSDTIRYSLANTKSSHFQVRLLNETLYSPFELVSLSYRVAGLTTKGETEAVDTSTKAGRRVDYISGALTPRRN